MNLTEAITHVEETPQQQNIEHTTISTVPTSLPPLKVPILPKSVARATKSLLSNANRNHITDRLDIYSIKTKLRNDKLIENILLQQRKKIALHSMNKKRQKTQQKQSVFLSTKVGQEKALPRNEIRPALKAVQDQFKIRELSISKYLSDTTILDDYKMLSHLGKGCFSVVTLAVHKQTNQRYAIKTYSKIDQIQNYKFDNIYRQISHLHNLTHQNIVGLLHVIKDKRKLLLIMQHGGQLSLAGLLRKNNKLTEPIAKRIFKQIVEGIYYCHQNGISHRDIKLENILVDGEDEVKIIDFGFSAKCGQKLQNHCGTPPYMAPEVTARVQYHGESADMWALGVLLYLLLFGKFPFRATTETELYRLIQQGKYQLPEGISPNAKQTITKLLKCNTKERATAAQILSCAWLN